MSEYQKSEKHLKNALNASKEGIKKIKELKEERIKKYYENPNLCKQCGESISYEKKNSNVFCGSSCSATFTNKTKIISDKQKEKVSDTLKKKYASGELISIFSYNRPNNNIKKSCKLKYTNCKICDKTFIQKTYGKRKTCSKKCRTIASVKIRTYQNGSRKTTWYFNKWQDKKVLLESSWEVETAKLLDELNIKWERPESIEWIDKKDKTRLYFPDFLLNDFNIFLDPKNKYCMSKDKYKLEQVTKKINLIYGELDLIKQYIKNL